MLSVWLCTTETDLKAQIFIVMIVQHTALICGTVIALLAWNAHA